MLTKAWLVRSCHKHNNTRNKSLLPKVVSLFLGSICFTPFLPFFMWPPIACAEETFGTPEKIWQEVGKQERTAGFQLQALSVPALQTNQAEITNEAFLPDDELQDWIGRREKMRGGEDLRHTHTQRQAKLWEAIVWIAKLWHEFRTPFFQSRCRESISVTLLLLLLLLLHNSQWKEEVQETQTKLISAAAHH